MIDIVYVAGPFDAPTAWEREQNVRQAERIGLELAKLGVFPIVSHAIGRYWYGEITGDEAMAIDFKAIAVSDAIMLGPGWRRSRGTIAEIQYAHTISLPVYTGLNSFIHGQRADAEYLLSLAQVEPWEPGVYD